MRFSRAPFLLFIMMPLACHDTKKIRFAFGKCSFGTYKSEFGPLIFPSSKQHFIKIQWDNLNLNLSFVSFVYHKYFYVFVITFFLISPLWCFGWWWWWWWDAILFILDKYKCNRWCGWYKTLMMIQWSFRFEHSNIYKLPLMMFDVCNSHFLVVFLWDKVGLS